MMRSFSSAVSGMRTQMSYMDVVANNIANVNTTAFKSQRARFADMLYQTLRAATGTQGNISGTNPDQIGLGVRLAGIDNKMAQGSLQTTGNPLDLAIEGDGFFVLQDANNANFYTRDGAFGLDSQGYLINPSNGMRVQGQGGPIQIQPGQYVSVSVRASGEVIGMNAQGQATTIGTIQVATFPNPAGLARNGDNLWRQTAASGDANNQAGNNGQGSIRGGMLEGSNVDLAQEFSNMIAAQRGFQANSRVITASDEILQDLVNIKR
jgi:flagellar hook protein FlgE